MNQFMTNQFMANQFMRSHSRLAKPYPSNSSKVQIKSIKKTKKDKKEIKMSTEKNKNESHRGDPVARDYDRSDRQVGHASSTEPQPVSLLTSLQRQIRDTMEHAHKQNKL